MKVEFRTRLEQGHTMLFDGAMGTMLYERGVFLNRSFEEVCLSDPRLVLGIHREYLDAGADVITTNSWGAGILKLRAAGLVERFQEINRRAVELARQAVTDSGRSDSALVAGSIGPLGAMLAPLGTLSPADAEEMIGRQAEVLAAAGADLLVLETFVDVAELKAAVRAVRAACQLPLIASMTINADGTSPYGTEPEAFTAELDELAPDVIGLNCSEGPRSMLEAGEKMIHVTGHPLCIQPNAGVPVNVDGRNIYQTTPKYMAKYAKRMIQSGVRIVGGCCGTTPAHIHEIRNEIKALAPGRPRESARVSAPAPVREPVPLEKKSAWAAKLAAGEFVTCVELVPPKGIDMSKLIDSACALKARGIDAVNVPDSPRAQAKMAAVSAASVLQQRAGIEVIPHVTCKDKNLLALQAEVLGAHALGIRNILLVTGDPPSMGTYPDATAVFDVDAIGLCTMVSQLNRGVDLGKNAVGEPTAFCYGVALNPSAVNLDRELERFRWKLDAGAEFAITQPVFDARPLLDFLQRAGSLRRVPVIAGIWPLVSLRMAEFMKNEVPGVYVPDTVIERMSRCDTKESALAEGTTIARELLEELRGAISGVQLSTPFGRIDYAMTILGR
ncbi:MAG TPA: bifunctional homocysteine S-methyltransferase/methylenetetrahydrofolate reductase [Spirochaetia bacterium]|nr:bifunctional homocysteine S-methyltransferase/methylenetetrahydrofolate reductase [Spirochaetia bacterium]